MPAAATKVGPRGFQRVIDRPRDSKKGKKGKGKVGLCNDFNNGHCDFGNDCKYKHNCKTCGGTHPAVKCKKSDKKIPR